MKYVALHVGLCGFLSFLLMLSVHPRRLHDAINAAGIGMAFRMLLFGIFGV